MQQYLISGLFVFTNLLVRSPVFFLPFRRGAVYTDSHFPQIFQRRLQITCQRHISSTRHIHYRQISTITWLHNKKFNTIEGDSSDVTDNSYVLKINFVKTANYPWAKIRKRIYFMSLILSSWNISFKSVGSSQSIGLKPHYIMCFYYSFHSKLFYFSFGVKFTHLNDLEFNVFLLLKKLQTKA